MIDFTRKPHEIYNNVLKNKQIEFTQKIKTSIIDLSEKTNATFAEFFLRPCTNSKSRAGIRINEQHYHVEFLLENINVSKIKKKSILSLFGPDIKKWPLFMIRLHLANLVTGPFQELLTLCPKNKTNFDFWFGSDEKDEILSKINWMRRVVDKTQDYNVDLFLNSILNI